MLAVWMAGSGTIHQDLQHCWSYRQFVSDLDPLNCSKKTDFFKKLGNISSFTCHQTKHAIALCDPVQSVRWYDLDFCRFISLQQK